MMEQSHMSNDVVVKEVDMTPKQIREEIEFEDMCGVNTLLQNLLNDDIKKRAKVCMQLNKEEQNCGYIIRDKQTNEDIQL